MDKKLGLVTVLLAAFVFSSCVSMKKYKYMEEKYFNSFETNKNLEKEIETLNEQLFRLGLDTMRMTDKIGEMESRYRQLQRTYELLVAGSKQELEGKGKEIADLQTALMNKEKELEQREKNLDRLTRELLSSERELNESQARLETSRKELEAKQKRLYELEEILAKQKEAVESLRKKVSDALLVFENKGLTINVKNGKVYVSLEEQLLFATGSTKVDARGEEALKNLAQVLEANPDISVLIEGHTDNVPYVSSAGGIKDNWDLSVMRATSIVRILLKYGKIDPQRLIPTGRGEFVPVDPANTKEARAKNRRIEIILTPKLDELFRIIETN